MDARSETRERAEDLLCRNEELSRRVEELEAQLEEARAELDESEGRRKESEERFSLTFEKAAIGMAHVSPDGKWLRVNDKLPRIVGYKDELLSLTFQDITHPEDLDTDLEYVSRLLEGKMKSYAMEKRYVRKDGSRVWTCLSVSLVRGAWGEPAYFISVVEDITERKISELVPDPLTEKEKEVLGLIVRRRTNQQIAGELNYSEATVKLHVQGILAKLGVARRAEAAERTVEIGLVSPPNHQTGEKDAKRPRNTSRFDVPLGNGRR